jgi:hypothetical protein
LSRKPDEELLDSLALKYAQDQSMDTLKQLLALMQPLIEAQLKKWRSRYPSGDISELRSVFLEDIWKIARDFTGEPSFLVAYRDRVRKRTRDWVRRISAKKRKTDKDGLSYENLLFESGETSMIHDSESEVLANIHLEEFLAQLSGEQARIFNLMRQGYGGAELAKKLGHESYSAALRKKVSRLKKNFRNYLFA